MIDNIQKVIKEILPSFTVNTKLHPEPTSHVSTIYVSGMNSKLGVGSLNTDIIDIYVSCESDMVAYSTAYGLWSAMNDMEGTHNIISVGIGRLKSTAKFDYKYKFSLFIVSTDN